jgi:demethylmenaquinone methyltransferase/2-methoxy-6-polyprenyl-1,4-benzoquinol methylase
MQSRASGAAPQGTADEQAAASAVREMFTAIAPRYDLLNHLLSFNIDRIWWRKTARTFAHILRRDDAAALDLCCGTGDMALALARARRGSRAQITGVDFSAAMLERARQKSADRFPDLQWLEADALHLPVPDASFDLVVSAFGFRNLANYQAGLREIARVLKPGGQVGILEFGRPRGISGALYKVYFRRVLPRVGSFISGVRGPYQYLPDSVERFPSNEGLVAMMRDVGFCDVSWRPYTFGISGLFRGTRSRQIP